MENKNIITALLEKDFNSLTQEEKSLLDFHFLSEAAKKAAKALILINFYKVILLISTTLCIWTSLGELPYMDQPAIFLGIMFFCVWVIKRNTDMYKFCSYAYNRFDR